MAWLVPGVELEPDVGSTVRDGTTLVADVYRPAGGGEHPVLLIRTPYGKRAAESDAGYAHPSWYARHGYVVVAQDTRGRGSSEGEFVPFRHEAADGYDSVEWAARLPGANGKVGMYGFSYPGAAQLLAATTRPPSLMTICPAFTASQFYEGWTYRGGALSLAFVASWALQLASDTARRRGDDGALETLIEAAAGAQAGYGVLPLRAHAALGAGDAPFYLEWLRHESYDDFWRATAVDEDYGRITVPALHIGGWWDIFATGTVANFTGLRAAGDAPQKLLVGPWAHTPWAPIGTDDPAAGCTAVDDWQLRWFDHVLKQRDTGVLASPVTVYVGGAGWRDFDAWPPVSARIVDWYLHSGGRANSRLGDGTLSTEPPGDELADVFVYDPAWPVASAGGHSCCDGASAPVGPACQAEVERLMTVLVYTSTPLPEPIELVGDVEVTVFAASSARDTDFTAKLCLVDETGRSTNLLEGVVRARFRESLASPSPLEPGRVYELTIALGPTAVRIPRGHRLRLDISSSDFPQWDRNLNTGGALGVEPLSASVVATQAVYHDLTRPSCLRLPSLGALSAGGL